MVDFRDTKRAFSGLSNVALRRAILLFRVLGMPWLSRLGGWFAQLALKLRLPIRWLFEKTIYAHFCGGVSMAACDKRIGELHGRRVGSILDFGVEGKSRESDFVRVFEETQQAIARAEQDPRIPFCVFKCSGLISINVLEEVSREGEPSADNRLAWDQFSERVDALLAQAYHSGVRVMIDAEESWIQAAIDQIAEEGMRKYNQLKCIVFNTVQLYRVDRLAYLKAAIERAKDGDYAFGVKLVRGAYMEKERARAMEHGYADPIHATKAETDGAFDAGLRHCLESIEHVFVCSGSHNEASAAKLSQWMEELGISHEDERVFSAQLLGMSDHISFNLAAEGFNVAKYVPYGPVRDLVPYLIRRAEENSSIQGQSGRELGLLQDELKRRLTQTGGAR